MKGFETDMEPRFWTEHLRWLSESLMAQMRRIKAGSSHTLIKGYSIEVVLRRILSQYLPNSFHIGTGQIAHNLSEIKPQISPQIDILIYDRSTFPHLAVNEDSSVVICCESLYASVECKTKWDKKKVETHYEGFKNVESKRNKMPHSHNGNASGYFVFVLGKLKKPDLSKLQDTARCICVYSLAGERSWRSLNEKSEFTIRNGNALEMFMKDILRDCMRKEFVEIGSLENTREVVYKYFGWVEP